MLRAKMEAIERYACTAGPAARVREATGASLDGVYPLDAFTLYEEEQYATPDFPFTPPDPQHNLLWLEVENLTRGGQAWLPLDFFVYPVFEGYPNIVSSSSNGAAAHVSKEAALTGGLLELIERDALLVTWLGRRVPSRIDSSTLPEAALAAIAYLDSLGQRVDIVDLTVDLGIFCVGAIARNSNGDWPAFLLGASAHPDPAQAVTKAVDEVLIQMLAVLDEGPEEAPTSDSMRSVMDHRAFYLSPQNADLWSFMLEGQTIPLPATPSPKGLTGLVRHLADREMDVLVGELTCRELRGTPIRVFKVVVPQLQPLYFDDRRRRVSRARLLSNGCDPDEINTAPHPLA